MKRGKYGKLSKYADLRVPFKEFFKVMAIKFEESKKMKEDVIFED